jgi:hypothetical protein
MSLCVTGFKQNTYNETEETERVTIVDINSVTVTAPSSFVVPEFNDIF